MKKRLFWLLACFGLALSAMACHDESSSGGNHGACKIGEKKCSEDGKGFILCGENLQWEEKVESCGEGLVCDPRREAACFACVLKAFKCSENKDGYFVCEQEGWSNMNNCEENLVCNADLKRCAEAACEDGKRRCSPNQLSIETCSAGSWSSRPCNEGQICSLGNCITMNSCTPNVDVCRVVGTEAGMYHCTEEGVYGDFVESCPQGCNHDNSACYVETCDKEGEVRCSPDLLESQICKEGHWTTKEFCPDTSLCDQNECKPTVCRPGTDVCAGSGKAIGMYHCTASGQIGDLIEYCLQCNSDHSACLQCNEGNFQCTDKGVFQGCEQGIWKDLVSCGDAANCSSGGKTLGCLCTPSEDLTSVEPPLRCNEDKSATEACVNLKYAGVSYIGWEKWQDCGGADRCDFLSNSRKPVCTCSEEGQYICNGQTLQSCETDWLHDIESCSPQETCDAENKKCVCIEGERRCNNGIKPEICKNGAWIEDIPCSKSEKCNEKLGSVCVSYIRPCMTDGQSACLANQLMTCSNGVYELDKTCESYCNATSEESAVSCSSTCTPRYLSCSPDYSAIQMCNEDGNGTTDKACDPGKRCVSVSAKEATCEDKVCDEGSYICDGSSVAYCYQNQYVQLTDCSRYKNMVCSAGKCVVSE